jgi:hypothetical protein
MPAPLCRDAGCRRSPRWASRSPPRPSAPPAPAPRASGAKTTRTRAEKERFGTALGGSRVWFTLARGELTEVDYPRLDAPSVRDLELRIGARVATSELTASPGLAASVAALGRCGQCRNACERGGAVSR